ncbi:MAG: peptide chain release factor 1 [Candidatus Omnitrophica bacterium]|nr:peptide chain release factor 1 [Candidatus Omnitrophota bacterium]
MLKESNLRKLGEARKRLAELQDKLADASVISDQDAYQKFAKEFADITPVVEDHTAYVKVAQHILEAEHILTAEKDQDLREMATAELLLLKAEAERLERQINDYFNPQTKENDRNVIMEIRAGTGGMEASLFAADLHRMYTKYAASRKWKVEIIELSESERGIKEVIFSVSGKLVWKCLKWESGTHRVQRVPETEASGRIHTSAATVAVLSEPEEVELAIDPKDLKIDVYRASGPGGQGVNTADSAIRITHIPTNIVVTCQDERSQLKNKIKGMRVLRARLMDSRRQEIAQREAATRKAQVGSGDRSEKIRTYNFPDHRVTDHRIGFTTHQLPAVLEGALDELVDALLKAEEDMADNPGM